jgi:NitT/TauT family transport system substrate-binding protein
MLKQDSSLAARVGEERFPEFEAGLITDVVKRDLPNYQPALSEAFIESMCRYARETGMPCGFPRYEEVVATEFTRLWDAA